MYLLLVGASALVLFAIPLLVSPLTWAELFRWRAPLDDAGRALANYFGRCLGAVACGLAGACTWAGASGVDAREHVVVCTVGGALLTVIHIVGAFARVQPWTETAEIPLWALVTLAGIYIL